MPGQEKLWPPPSPPRPHFWRVPDLTCGSWGQGAPVRHKPALLTVRRKTSVTPWALAEGRVIPTPNRTETSQCFWKSQGRGQACSSKTECGMWGRGRLERLACPGQQQTPPSSATITHPSKKPGARPSLAGPATLEPGARSPLPGRDAAGCPGHLFMERRTQLSLRCLYRSPGQMEGGKLRIRADAPAGAMRGHGACREGAGQGAHERKSFGMSTYPLGLSGNQT